MLLEVYARAIALCLSAFGFGVMLKLSDLLQEHGYRWFRGSAFVTGVIAAGLALVMLALGHSALHLLWVAVLASWIVRGRIDGANHGVMAAAMIAFLLSRWPIVAIDPYALWYFVVPFVTLGAIHDLLQYTSLRAPRPVEWFFEHQHLYWYLIAGGYCLLFEIDVLLCLGAYGFVKGYGYLYDEKRREGLRRLGIRHVPTASDAAR